MSLTSNSIISYSTSESHWPQFKTDRSLSELIQTSGTAAKVISKEKKIDNRKNPSTFRVMKIQTYPNMLQIPLIALCICRSTDIKGTCPSWGILAVRTAENRVMLLAEQPNPKNKAIDPAHGNVIYSSYLQGKCLQNQWFKEGSSQTEQTGKPSVICQTGKGN